MAKPSTPRAPRATPAPVAPAPVAPAPVGTALAAHIAAQQNTATPAPTAAPAAPTAAALAAVHAAQVAPTAANQASTPASPAQASAQAAHKAAGHKAGNAGGVYRPASIGAQIAAACNALQALHPNTVPTAAAVLLHMPTVNVNGVVLPLCKASASCGVSHWRKAQGKLRVKGQTPTASA